MADEQSVKVPDFVEFFAEVRGDPTKHLSNKGEDGEYLVPDVAIGRFAAQLLASEFYSTPWLTGCEPATVLPQKALTGLGSDNPKRVRQAVNAAFSAELRIISMGMEAYVRWCLQGRPREQKQEESVIVHAPQVVGIHEAKAREILADIDGLRNIEAITPALHEWAAKHLSKVRSLLEGNPGQITSYDLSQLEKIRAFLVRQDDKREHEVHAGALLRLRSKLIEQCGGDPAKHLHGKALNYVQELDSMKSLGRPRAVGDLKWSLGLLLEKINEAKQHQREVAERSQRAAALHAMGLNPEADHRRGKKKKRRRKAG